jgi:hypothetical protein
MRQRPNVWRASILLEFETMKLEPQYRDGSF